VLVHLDLDESMAAQVGLRHPYSLARLQSSTDLGPRRVFVSRAAMETQSCSSRFAVLVLR
jgi:hypothetical protein